MTGDETNLFAAPAAPILPTSIEALNEAEEIRWTYLRTEGSAKTVAGYGFLLGGFWLLGTASNILQALGFLPGDANIRANPAMASFETIGYAVGAIVGLVFCLATWSIGVGLRKLQAWARWFAVALLGMAGLLGLVSFVVVLIAAANATPVVLLVFALPAIILAYSLRTLLTSDAKVVFSPEYRQIVRATPAIRSHSSIVIKIAYGLYGVLVVLFIIGIFVIRHDPNARL